MQIRRIAILHNVRPALAEPPARDDLYEEYDSPETIESIAEAIRSLGVTAVPIPAGREFPRLLEEGGFDLVFNIAEGQGRRCRELVPAAILEFMGLPFTGSDALTLGITLDKAVCRRVVSPEVPIARAVLFQRDADLHALSYPVVVKPNDEGSSIGIVTESLCTTPAAASDRCLYLEQNYGCPVLVEEYVPGCEVTVAVWGNNPAQVLGIMEIAPADDNSGAFLYSLDAKRNWRQRVRYFTPPRLDAHSARRVADAALTAYRLLGCRDVARFDFRFDAEGIPRFIECNPLPGLHPTNSDLVLMTRGSMSHAELIARILRAAADRYSLQLP